MRAKYWLIWNSTANDVGFAGEGLSLSHADRFLFDAILRYITLAERPQDKGYIGNLIQREILYRILSQPGRYDAAGNRTNGIEQPEDIFRNQLVTHALFPTIEKWRIWPGLQEWAFRRCITTFVA